jgi:hypothetical protein
MRVNEPTSLFVFVQITGKWRPVMVQFRSVFLAALTLVGVTFQAAAQDAQKAKAGMLTCKTSASLGLIVGSHQRLRCSFVPNDGGAGELYSGHIGRLGLDVGVRAAGVLAWAVIAPTNGIHRGALAGTYVGASGDASLGLGVGAKVLVGGSHRSIALQPVSIEGQAGINLALGVASLNLRAE